MMESTKKPLGRDASLLLIGAFISLLTSQLGNFIKERSELKKEKVKSKLEFNYELSKAIGNRYYYTYNLIQRKGSNDTVLIREETSGFLRSRQSWNENIYSYRALLINYYGRSIKEEFDRKIHAPFVAMGHYVENQLLKKDANSSSMITQIGPDITRFMEKLYALVEE